MDDKLKGMSIEESEAMSNFAGYLHDAMQNLTEEEKKLLAILREEWLAYDKLKFLSPRELFVLGFLRGRELTLQQLGVYDDDDDDDMDLGEPPEIIKHYLEHMKEKK